MAEKTINTSSPSVTSAIFGTFDANINAIENAFNVRIVNRPLNNDLGDCITISGEDGNVNDAYEVLMYLKKMAEMNSVITDQTVDYVITTVSEKRTSELNELDDSFYQLTGEHMRYIRPPKGEFSERTLAISADLGYKTVLWSFAYADWHTDKVYGAQYAYDHVMPYLHDGAVLLLHAVSKDNADALYQIIADAKAKGYTFKSLDEL